MSANTELAILGKNIAAARQKRHLTQEQLAQKSGLHRTYISDVERGGRNLGLLSLTAIARGLHLSVSHLTRGIENHPPSPSSPSKHRSR